MSNQARLTVNSNDGSGAIPFLKRFHPRGPWVLTAIAEQRGTRTASFGPGREAEAQRWIAWQQRDRRNVYFLVGEPERDHLTKKAQKGDIAGARFLWVDLDGAPTDWRDEASVVAELERLRARLDAFPLPPTVVVRSGGGLQAFWMLDVSESEDPDAIELANKTLAEVLGGDHCHNIDRIMRLPGTINFPNQKKRDAGRAEAPAVLEFFDDTRFYGFAALFETAKALAPEKTKEEKVPSSAYKNPTDSQIPHWLLKKLRTAPPQGERSQAFFAAAMALFDLGLSETQAVAAFAECPAGVAAKFVERGELVQEVARCRGKWRPKKERALEKSRNGHDYEATEFGIFWNKPSRDGGTWVRLANFTARIAAEIIEDDGVENRRAFEIEATLKGQSHRFVIPAADFPAMNWVTERLGGEAIINAGNGTEKRAREAIQELSGAIAKRQLYTHTGWRKIGEDWFYLHGGGAIGAGGAVPGVDVALPPALKLLILPEPPEGERLVRAVRASLALLDLAPIKVMAAALGAVYRAPLSEAAYSLHIAGRTGNRKSELAARAMQHFGAGWCGKKLPAYWEGTANANEALAFVAKDVLFVIDDFLYPKEKAEAARLNLKADRLFRSQGNGSGRLRMRPDASLQSAKPPRGLILSTGEDTPAGHSMRARLFILALEKGGVNLERLSAAQESGAAGVYAEAMAGYVRWLAPRYEETRDWLASEVTRLRAGTAKFSVHGRTADIVSDLFAAWNVFLHFALEAGAATKVECEALLERVWEALSDAARDQEEEQRSADPVERFLDLLRSALLSGKAHVADRNGARPEKAAQWGWRSDELLAWHALGPRVGWIDGEELYIEPNAAYAAAQAMGEAASDRLELPPVTLYKRLHERGGLLTVEQRGGKIYHKIRKTLDGAQKLVLHLPASMTLPSAA